MLTIEQKVLIVDHYLGSESPTSIIDSGYGFGADDYEKIESFLERLNIESLRQLGRETGGTYIGDDVAFSGRAVCQVVDDFVFAQFNEGPKWAQHSWITFHISDWELDE